MSAILIPADSEIAKKLKWLMFSRVLFTTVLLGSVIVLQLGESASFLAEPLLMLYGLIAGIFLLSIVYSIILPYAKQEFLFAYIQIIIDTVVVALIIFVTGGFSSIFSFLYLVVIVYSSMLLYGKGSMVIAALCSIEYGIMVDLEFYGILEPFVFEESLSAVYYDWRHVIYKIIITVVACFAVAFLSSLLSEQDRKSKKKLWAMADHVKRVDKLAAVGEMAAGLTHEIKNPLASLIGSIQILREDIAYDPDIDRLMQIVLREADRLNSLVSNFLMFAKPPSGQIEAIELNHALAETIKLFENDKSFRDRISVKKEFSERIWVEMDQTHLRQIFWNLLLNAGEAITGAGLIHIRLYPLKNQYAGIQIVDTGCGMPSDVIDSIFDPFFTTKPSGTGLGLSIIHSILESYGSQLDVESLEGKGTTFTLRLKRIDPPSPPIQS